MLRVLIAGCGFLGETAAGLFLQRGCEVLGLTSSPRDPGDTEFPIIATDLTDSAALTADLSDRGPFDIVVHCASSRGGGPDGYRRIYRDGLQNLVTACPDARIIFTGSTSVYGQADGTLVDETSPTDPGRETGRILLETERLALDVGGFVARLAGIYGPGRSVLRRKFLDGTAILEDGGGRWINQIHRDDAARALVHLARSDAPPGIYNVADNTPATQRQVYGWLADHFDQPLPPDGPANPNRKRGSSSKRVSNAKLRSTGWAPTFPSYRDGLATLTEPQ